MHFKNRNTKKCLKQKKQTSFFADFVATTVEGTRKSSLFVMVFNNHTVSLFVFLCYGDLKTIASQNKKPEKSSDGMGSLGGRDVKN